MHHDRTTSTDQYGNRVEIVVLSTRDAEGTPERKADVALQIYSGGVSVCFDLTPAAARDLAERLARASLAATTPEPEIIDFTLYREPEAA